MNLYMESQGVFELTEKSEQCLCPCSVVIERSVEYADFPYAVSGDVLQPGTYAFDGKSPYRFFSAADTKGAGVETSTGRFQLNERFLPVEKTARFGSLQPVELLYMGCTVVVICSPVVEITESGDVFPLFDIIGHLKPLREMLFSFAPEYTVDIRMCL